MSRSRYFAHRKLLVCILVVGFTLYILFSERVGLFPSSAIFQIPEYVITEGYSYQMYRQRSRLYSQQNTSSSTRTFVYIRSKFTENRPYISTLLRHNGYVASVLSDEFTDEELSAERVFLCTCGRISDPCICCGVLKPQMSNRNHLSPDLYKAILLKGDDKQPAHFCLNTTYLPNKKQIKTSGVLVNLTSDVDIIPNKLHPKAEKTNDNVIRFTHVSTVFDTVYLPSLPLPMICAGHHQNDYIIDLCVNFTTLEYKFDSDSDHKTIFHGCALIQIVLNRVFIIAKYPKFCFDAHRGAAGDADQASNRKISNTVSLNTLSPSNTHSAVLPEPTQMSNSISTSNSSSDKDSGPSFHILKDSNKKPMAPLKDSHELHLGIP